MIYKENIQSSNGKDWYKVWAKIEKNKIINMGCECPYGLNNQKAYKKGEALCRHCKYLIERIYILKKKGLI